MGTCVIQGFIEVGWLVLLQVPEVRKDTYRDPMTRWCPYTGAVSFSIV